PALSQLKCVKVPAKQCTLTGSSLFLIDSIAGDPNFTNSISVPEGYADLTLVVPHPDASKTLYVKLRDDPSAINTAQVIISQPVSSSAAETQQPTPPNTAAVAPAPATASSTAAA